MHDIRLEWKKKHTVFCQDNIMTYGIQPHDTVYNIFNPKVSLPKTCLHLIINIDDEKLYTVYRSSTNICCIFQNNLILMSTDRQYLTETIYSILV